MSDHCALAALDEAGSDPCGNWGEGTRLNFSLDLIIVLNSSQELVNAAISENEETEASAPRELSSEESSYVEHNAFFKVNITQSCDDNGTSTDGIITPTNSSSSSSSEG